MPSRGTPWHHATRHALIAGHNRGGRLRNRISVLDCFYTTHVASRAARSATVGRVPHPVNDSQQEPNVDPSSLRNTLDAHREANRASLIVKIAGKGTGRQAIRIPSLVKQKDKPPAARLHDVKGSRSRASISSRHKKTASAEAIPRQPHQWPGTSHTRVEFEPQWALDPGLLHSEKYPWIRYMEPQSQTEPETRSTAIEELGREIDGFSLYAQATSEERNAAEQALQQIRISIEAVNPEVKVDVVGSRATGLDSPVSDIDLNISTVSVPGGSSSPLHHLQQVAEGLRTTARKNGLFRNVVLRSDAKIPIVTGRHRPSYLEFQVQSTEHVFLSLQQTMSFVNEFPTLRSIFFVLKQMLAMRGMTRGNEEGLASYPLLVMIVAALKFSEGKIDRRDTGGQLLFFLDMYSDIDFTTTAISFSPLQYVVKRHPHSSTLPQVRSAARAPDNVPLEGTYPGLEDQDIDARRRFATIKPGAEHLMCLQDPADLRNDVGRAAYKIREVQGTFIRVRGKLMADLKLWENGEAHDAKTPLLASCIGGDYRLFEQTRQALRESINRAT